MNLLDLQSDPAQFRRSLLIDTDSGPRPFADAMDEWQARDFSTLDAGWLRAVNGSSHDAQYQRAWLERPRGHSKSMDLGVMAAWALFASRRRLSLIGCAADIDQARLLRDAIGKLVYINPWLSTVLEVQNNRVLNVHTESTLDIIASDAKSAYGLTPDGLICDEVVHWKNGDLWDAMLSSAAKRSTCMVVCISNAGIMDDEWVWKLREAVRTSPTWYFSRLSGPTASWISPELLQEQERLLPSIAYRRLWLNEWTSGGGDALTPEVIAAAFLPDLQPQQSAEPGWEYVGGLDLGVSRDNSAVCILGIRRQYDGHGQIRLAHTRLWRPTKTQKVNLQDVEDTLKALSVRFQLKTLCFDPWQATFMSQRLTAAELTVPTKTLRKLWVPSKVPMTEVPPTSTNLQRIATVVIEAFNDARLQLYEDNDLRRDLTRLRVEERSYGFRLTSPHDQYGHGDAASAFCLAMVAASELSSKKKRHIGVMAEATSSADGWIAAEMKRVQSKADWEKYIAEQPADYRNIAALKEAFRRAGSTRPSHFTR